MNIKNILQQIGLNTRQSEVYLACLELGKATAYLIAKKTGIKRPSVYDIVEVLMREGLLYKNTKNKITYYYPNDPLVLISKSKEKIKQIEDIMPMLQNLYMSSSVKPFIRYFEGKEGIKEIYEDTLKTLKHGETILSFTGEGVKEHLPDYTEEYLKKRIAKGIRIRGIFKKIPETTKHIKNSEAELRTGKFLDQEAFPFSNEINIYKNKVVVATYGKEMFGMLIESKEFYNSMKVIFELAWEGARFREKLDI